MQNGQGDRHPDSGPAYLGWLCALACGLAVVGARCLVVGLYGGPTPFWDQWDAEGVTLYQPFFSGDLRLVDLIIPHNEHRILLTRLLALLLLLLNGYWDPLLQMVVNSLLSGAIAALLILWLRPLLDAASMIVVTLFALVVLELPITTENILAGFQSQWYFLLLFSLVGLFFLHAAAALTARWWLALLLLSLSYFCMAGGALSLATGTALAFVQLLTGRRAGAKEWIVMVIIAFLAALAMLAVPTVEAHKVLKAQSISDFLNAAVVLASWPLGGSLPTPKSYVFAIIVHAPAVLFSICVIARGPALSDRGWLIVALTGWIVLNVAATAYGRAQAITASRYLEPAVLALPLNAACLLLAVTRSLPGSRQWKFAFVAFAIWLPLMLGGTVLSFKRVTLPHLAYLDASFRAETENLRAYLATGDIAHLENKPFLQIPYPDARRLATFASRPQIRAVLSPELVGQLSADATRAHGLARITGPAADMFKVVMLKIAPLLMALGFAVVLLSMLAVLHNRRAEPSA